MNAPIAPGVAAGNDPARKSSWRQAVRAAMAAALPRQLFLVHGPKDRAEVCLTFDDGPDPEHTPSLLDALQRLGVRATFFLIGQRAERHPEIVRRMAAEGHAIAGHSYAHGAPQSVSAVDLLREVCRTDQILAPHWVRPNRLFRPPHGKVTASKLCRLWLDRRTVVLWNVDPKDFACRDAEELRARLLAAPLNGGDIVLLHDNHPHAARILPDLITSARDRGLEFTTVCSWIDRR